MEAPDNGLFSGTWPRHPRPSSHFFRDSWTEISRRVLLTLLRKPLEIQPSLEAIAMRVWCARRIVW